MIEVTQEVIDAVTRASIAERRRADNVVLNALKNTSDENTVTPEAQRGYDESNLLCDAASILTMLRDHQYYKKQLGL